MIDFKNGTVSLEFFRRVLKEIKHKPDRRHTLLDSLSDNQFSSKKRIVELIDKLNLSKETEVVIFGCWYGSVLIPLLCNDFKRITGIDKDDDSIKTSKSNLFNGFPHIDFITDDVFTRYLERYKRTSLIINCSCENMRPMKDWPWWGELKTNSYFALQSTNIDITEDQRNCVYSMDEFKNQLPKSFKILYEDELTDDRGIRYSLVGQIN